MTWKELYADFLNKLQTIYTEDEAEAMTKILFSWVSGDDRNMLFQQKADQVEDYIVTTLETSLDRLLKHTPLQYVTGESWFYNLKFFVTNAVLIPRPETEELVRDALYYLKSRRALRVLDIGTGSGCIAITIKCNSPDAEVTAIDISEEALDIAKKNAQEHDTRINFHRMDFLRDAIKEKFDVIVSNPPYIPQTELLDMDKNVVSFEPHTALFVPDNDPLLFYKKIAEFASTNLGANGKVFVETHQHYAHEVAALFVKSGFTAEAREDMFGKQRFVWATHSL